MNVTDLSPERRAELVASILARAHPPNENGCRVWMSDLHEGSNYPKFRVCKTQRNAHAWVWVLTLGVPLSRSPVMHKCNNTRCVAFEHLELGTQSQNVRDAWRDGLRRHRHKWCESAVRLMRYLHDVRGRTTNTVARVFNTSPNGVYMIVNRNRRADVSDWPPFEEAS